MARIERFPERVREHLLALPLPSYPTTPFVSGPPLEERRLAILSTAALHRRGDRPFTSITGEYRIIPGDTQSDELLMSHVSVNFDRSGFQQDWNVVFPLDRARERVAKGRLGSVADFHYALMGAADPSLLEESAGELADLLKRDGVTAALLVPV